jgi:hypothetical protein
MNRRSALGALAAFVAAALLALPACDSTEPPDDRPVPGTLAVRLSTPHADDAALVLRLSGPTQAEPQFEGDLLGFTRAGENAVRVAIFGELRTGTLLRFAVPDVRQVGSFRAELQEVADAGNAVREALTGYGVTVVVE